MFISRVWKESPVSAGVSSIFFFKEKGKGKKLKRVSREDDEIADLPLSPPERCLLRCRRRYQARCCTAHPEKNKHN